MAEDLASMQVEDPMSIPMKEEVGTAEADAFNAIQNKQPFWRTRSS